MPITRLDVSLLNSFFSDDTINETTSTTGDKMSLKQYRYARWHVYYNTVQLEVTPTAIIDLKCKK